MENRIVGIFYSEEEVMDQIKELESQGYRHDDIYAVAKDEDDVSVVRGRANIDIRTTGVSWIDRFVGFLTGEQPVREALHDAGITGPDMDKYYRQIEDHDGILLYVDQDVDARAGIQERVHDDSPIARPNVDKELHTEAGVVAHSEQPTDDATPHARMNREMGDDVVERADMRQEPLDQEAIMFEESIMENERPRAMSRRDEPPADTPRAEHPVMKDEEGLNEAYQGARDMNDTEEPTDNPDMLSGRNNVYGDQSRMNGDGMHKMHEDEHMDRPLGDMPANVEPGLHNDQRTENPVNFEEKEEGVRSKLDEELARRRAELEQNDRESRYGNNSNPNRF